MPARSGHQPSAAVPAGGLRRPRLRRQRVAGDDTAVGGVVFRVFF
jgi:hypothetical protein